MVAWGRAGAPFGVQGVRLSGECATGSARAIDFDRGRDMADAQQMGEAVRMLLRLVHKWNRQAQVLAEFGSNEAPLLGRVRDELQVVVDAFGKVELDLEAAAAITGRSTRTLRRRLDDERVENLGQRYRPRIRCSEAMGMLALDGDRPVRDPRHPPARAL